MDSECIIWVGKKWSQGRYGMDVIDGKSMGAHRAAWIRTNGEIPEGMKVLHKCDNGLCVNVQHLFLGTLSDNVQDCIKKGRFGYIDQSGKNNGNARKDYQEIKQTVKQMRSEGKTYSQIKEVTKIKSNGHLRKLIIS